MVEFIVCHRFRHNSLVHKEFLKNDGGEQGERYISSKYSTSNQSLALLQNVRVM